MQNETSYKRQQSGDEQSFDIKQMIFKLINKWYLFIIFTAITLIISFFINRYSSDVYQTTGTVLIKEGRGGYDATAIMTNMSFGSLQNMNNEMAILRSYSLRERVIKKMNIEVTFQEKGRIITTELYQTSPFEVEFDRSIPQAVNLVYEISFLDNGTFSLHGTGEWLTMYDFILGETTANRPEIIDISGEYTQGEWIDNGYNKIRITPNERHNFETDKNRKLLFWLNSYPSLIKQMGKYSVSPINKSASIAAITINGDNKKKIVDFVNALMNEYVNRGLEKKNSISESTIQFIDNELEGIQESLDLAANDLKDFRTQNDLMNLDAQALQVYNTLMSLEKERAEKTVDVKTYKRLQEYIKNQIDDPENLAAPSTMGINDQLLNRLVAELVTLSQTRASQLLTQTEQHPQIVKLDEQIFTTKKTLLETVNNLVANAEMGLEEINKRIKKAEAESSVLPEKQRQLVNYQRNFTFNDDTYKYLMQRRAEAQILKASNTPDNEIIDEARLERTIRIAPRKSTNYLIALIIGLLIPALYIFLKDFFNTSITERKDVEKLTSFPIIGQIPQSDKKDPLVVVNSPKAPISEAFRSIRTNIEYLTQGKQKSTILVTGDMQSIGKTFNSINIASIYALYGKKTILLGFDMRKPKIFQEFGVSNNVGLSSFLSNQEPFEKIIQPSEKIPNLDLITSGPIPPNPAELIASEKCAQLFEELKKTYDYIIIDTPPLGLVTDAFLLMRYSDVNLFIVRQGVTNKNIFGSIIRDLENRNISTSIVINGVEAGKRYGYGKYSYSYGGYGYAYGYGAYGNYGGGYYGEDGERKKKKKKKKD